MKKKVQQEENCSDEDEEEEELSVSSSSSSLSIVDRSWISCFTAVRGHEFFVEVEKAWIEDEFNLYGLSHKSVGVSHYELALDTILDKETEYELNEKQTDSVQRSAELLYGLIHARFIITQRGLELMREKYLATEFGRCPRIFCEGQPALPVGQSDLPRCSVVKLFCPRCRDIYYPPAPKHSKIDGAYFGTTFPHLLLQSFPNLIPTPPKESYIPRIFGFKIHRSSTLPPSEEKNDKIEEIVNDTNNETIMNQSTNRSSNLSNHEVKQNQTSKDKTYKTRKNPTKMEPTTTATTTNPTNSSAIDTRDQLLPTSHPPPDYTTVPSSTKSNESMDIN